MTKSKPVRAAKRVLPNMGLSIRERLDRLKEQQRVLSLKMPMELSFLFASVLNDTDEIPKDINEEERMLGIHMAVLVNSAGTLRRLMNHGPVRGDVAAMAYMTACVKDHKDCVGVLVDYEFAADDAATLMYRCADKGLTYGVLGLVPHVTSHDDIQEALVAAARSGRSDTVKAFLNMKDIDVAWCDSAALLAARKSGSETCMRLLCKGSGEVAVLMAAARMGDVELMKATLTPTVDPEEDREIFDEALSIAATHGHETVVRWVMKSAPVNHRSVVRALVKACQHNHTSIALALIDVRNAGENALVRLVEAKSYDALRLLASMVCLDALSARALRVAVDKKDMKAFEILRLEVEKWMGSETEEVSSDNASEASTVVPTTA